MRTRVLPWLLPALSLVGGCKKDAPPQDGAKPADGSKSEPGSPAEVVAKAPATPEAKAPAAKTEPAVQARPLYYERPLQDADLEGRSLRELSLMRNTIFARAGNKFRKSWLDNHFRAQPWYQPADEPRADVITDVDRANAKKITEIEGRLTHKELEARRDAILAKPERDETDQLELRLLSIRLGTWLEGAGVPQAERTPMEDPSLLEALLRVDQLAELSRRDLRILRNTVYARRGRPFKSELLTIYFDQMDWYEPDPDYAGSKLTEVDRKNIRIIRSVEDSLGGPLADFDHMVQDGWLYGA